MSAKKKSKTSDESIGFSSDFPPRYGDFEIQSSDNMVFSFPRGVLSHASPVFKDMFASGDPNTAANQKPLVITENSTIIKNFLLYLDPLKESPDLTKDAIVPFLVVATKYQIPEMPEKFEKMVLGKNGHFQGIYAEEPMLALSVVEKLNWPKQGGVFMQHLVKAPQNEVLATECLPSSRTVMQLMELRVERGRSISSAVKRYIASTLKAAKYPDHSHPRYDDPEYTSDNEDEDEDRDLDEDGCLYDARGWDMDRYSKDPCALCRTKLLSLGFDIAMQMQTEPSWSAVLSTLSESVARSYASCQETLLADLLEEARGYGPDEDRLDQRSFRYDQLKAHVADLESEEIVMESLST